MSHEEQKPPSIFRMMKSFTKDLTKYMLDTGVNIKPLPKVIFKHKDKSNAKNFFGKTAYYNPNTQEIVLFTEGRPDLIEPGTNLFTRGKASAIPPPVFLPVKAANGFCPVNAPYNPAAVAAPPNNCCPNEGGGGVGCANCVVVNGAPVTTA